MNIQEHRNNLIAVLERDAFILSSDIKHLVKYPRKDLDKTIEIIDIKNKQLNKIYKRLDFLKRRIDKVLYILENLNLAKALLKLEIDIKQLQKLLDGYESKNKYFMCLVNDAYHKLNT